MRGSQPWRTSRSRVLRSQPISAEAKLWSKLRDRRLGGFKFVRQMPIGSYFADFACRDRRVIVEVDGGTHSTWPEVARDEIRNMELANAGHRIFRVHNQAIFDNIDDVLDALLAFVEESE